jgi:hypothetical protein
VSGVNFPAPRFTSNICGLPWLSLATNGKFPLLRLQFKSLIVDLATCDFN